MKTMESIYEEMKAQYAALTGSVPAEGGDLTLRLYTAAAQLYALWEQAAFVLRQSVPQTAVGEHLDHHAAMRGITRRPGTHAAGTLRFSVDRAAGQDISIPIGTTCTSAAGTAFETTQAGTLSAGELYCDVPARAVLSGTGGNVPVDSVGYMVLAPAGVSACSNPVPFAGGGGEESDESLRARVLTSYKRLPNGANIAYYETQALSVPGVAAVSVMPKHRGVGTVDVVITGVSGTPSYALITAVEEKLQAQREICMDLKVLSPDTTSVNITAAITTAPEFDSSEVRLAVRKAMQAYFNGALLGKPILRAELGRIIYGVEGVANYNLTLPAADLPGAADLLPVLGILRLSEAV